MTDEPTTDDPTDAFGLAREELIELLEGGDIEIVGRMPYSSNGTFLVVVSDGDRSHRGIYKPQQGERPLWDFPPGLYKREVATFRLADALGWRVVPPTVIASGPAGEGSVQAFVNGDFSEHYFTLVENGVGLDDLRKLCALDLISNNTDRKSGHCILGFDGHVYGIDHGLSFHEDWKLRTVMWDFVGEPLPPDIVEPLERFVTDGPPVELLCLLDPGEQTKMIARATALSRAGEFPDDETGGHRYPWPLI